jgi:E3 ubiquitin-protein ligase MYCBP2
VPGFGHQAQISANWVSAKGDRTTIQGHRRLFTRQNLDNCQVTANREGVALIPISRSSDSSTNCALIPYRSNSSFRATLDSPSSRSVKKIIALYFKFSWYFDPSYDILWRFDADKVRVIAYSNSPTLEQQNAEAEPTFFKNERQLLQCTELYVPIDADLRFSDTQLALFMLSTAYGLNLSGLAAIPTTLKDATGSMVAVSSSAADDDLGNQLSSANKNEAQQSPSCLIVNRFLNLGGGWGYSVHCLEAIQFKVNKDIYFYGLGLFGGRGENTARIKLFRNIGNHDSSEQNVNLLAETNEMLYECAAKETAFIGLHKPVLILAEVWHTIFVQVNGTSSDCGCDGQSVVQAGGVEFQFRNSIYSNNGTDVEGGQIPEIYYKIRHSNSTSNLNLSTDNDLQQLDRQAVSMLASVSLTAQTVFRITPETIRHLFRILEWAIRGSFQLKDYEEMQNDAAAARQERAAFVAIVSLRMIRLVLMEYELILFRIYLGIAFPKNQQARQKINNSSELINCVVEFHDLLNEIFMVADEKLFLEVGFG